MKNEMRGASPGEPLGARYRLWSFVTDGFVIRARCQGAFVCMCLYVSEGGDGDGLHCILHTTRIDLHNLHGVVFV